MINPESTIHWSASISLMTGTVPLGLMSNSLHHKPLQAAPHEFLTTCGRTPQTAPRSAHAYLKTVLGSVRRTSSHSGCLIITNNDYMFPVQGYMCAATSFRILFVRSSLSLHRRHQSRRCYFRRYTSRSQQEST
jgi:hypothetical protein